MNEKEIINRIENLDKRLTIIEKKINFVDKVEIKKVDFSVLAKISTTDVDNIKELFDIFDNKLNLIKPLFEDENNRVRIHNVVLIILICYKYILKEEIVLSSEIQIILKTQNISLNNYRTYMREICFDLILSVEGDTSQDFSYRLTNNGEIKAIELITAIFGS